MSPYAALPRELIDGIITLLISLHDNDPAYQWTSLRFITRHHKKVIEQHFYDYWVPKLSFVASLNEDHIDNHVYFEPLKEKNSAYFDGEKHDNGLPVLVAFEANRDADDLDESLDVDVDTWATKVMEAERDPAGCHGDSKKQLILRLGEGTLNKGFTRGGIVSDVPIPHARIHTCTSPWQLTFAWQKLFTRVFLEEIVLRRFRDALLTDHVPERNQTVLGDTKAVQKRNENEYLCLASCYEQMRRGLLDEFRKYAAWSLDPDAFGVTLFVTHEFPEQPYKATDTTIENTGREQSVVFQIPGWETWSIREVARLRSSDEDGLWDMVPEYLGYDGQQYYDEMCVRRDEMSGRKEASEEKLEEYLRGPSLDPVTFSAW